MRRRQRLWMSLTLILISLLSYLAPLLAIQFSDLISPWMASGFVVGIFAGFFSVYFEYFLTYQLKNASWLINKSLIFFGPLLSAPLFFISDMFAIGYLMGYLISFSQSLAFFLLMRRQI